MSGFSRRNDSGLVVSPSPNKKRPRALTEIRGSIDSLDDRILELLNERAEAVLEAGAWKQARGRAVFDPGRETRIIERLLERNRGPLDAAALEALYRGLIAGFRAFEERVNDGPVGERGVESGADGPEPGKGSPPLRTLAVVGCGLMGGSFAKAASRSLAGKYRLFVHDTRFTEAGAVVGPGLRTCDLSAVLAADLILLAMPVNAIVEFLRAHGKSIKAGAVVFDFGSTKRVICKTAETHCRDGVAFIGGHPLCGKESAGFENSDAELFRGTAFLLTPTSLSDDGSVALVSEAMAAVGARVLAVEAGAHDKHLAFASHLPQMVATALCLSAAEGWKDGGWADRRSSPPFPPSLLEMTRLGKSSGRVWSDIVASNADHLSRAIEWMKEHLSALQRGLDRGEIDDLFAAARAVRISIEKPAVSKNEESPNDHNHEKQSHGRSVA